MFNFWLIFYDKKEIPVISISVICSDLLYDDEVGFRLLNTKNQAKKTLYYNHWSIVLLSS